MNAIGFSTLLIDLLTEKEQESDMLVTANDSLNIPGVVLNKFNVELPSNRLEIIVNWVKNSSQNRMIGPNRIGFFSACTGANALLKFLSNLSQKYDDSNSSKSNAFGNIDFNSIVFVCRGGCYYIRKSPL